MQIHRHCKELPADLATRCVTPEKLVESLWILGPEFLWHPQLLPQASLLEASLSGSDSKVKREVLSCATSTHLTQILGCERLKHFSSWSSLRRAIASLIVFSKKVQGEKSRALKQSTIGDKIIETLYSIRVT